MMNSVFKKIFHLGLERSGLNKQIYEQVFSLGEVVNGCDGRKSLDGNFWMEVEYKGIRVTNLRTFLLN